MLNENKDILAYFEKEMNDITARELVKIEAEIASIRSQNIQTIEADIQLSNESLLAQDLLELKSEHAIASSKARELLNHQLMQKRQSLADEVFDQVIIKLNDFTKQDEYINWIKNKIVEMGKFCNDSSFAINIRFADRKIFETILEKLALKCSINIDPRMHLGGARFECEQLGIVNDDSFDAILEEQKQWFYANSKLFIK